MKKHLLLLLLSFVSLYCAAQDGWREQEMEIKVYLNTNEDRKTLHELNLSGDIYPSGYALMYVVPEELNQIRETGLVYEILKEDMNVYYRNFWDTRDAYHTYGEIIQLMNDLSSDYAGFCKKYNYGLSVDGRELAALKISDNVNEDEDEPEIMFDGGIHGDEIGASENLIRFAMDLCEGYGTDPQITELIDNREIWLYIMVNPDGRVNMSRYNSNGVDLNRDWGYMWNGEGSSTGPYSQVETKALRNCMYDNQYVIHTTYHSGTEYVSYPWSYRPDACPDNDHIDYLASLYSSLSGYPSFPYGQGYNGMYAINGSSKDTYYGVMGCVGWTIEISDDKQPPSSQIQYYYSINYPSMMALIEHSGYGIRGQVTDAQTGDPVPAIIWINDFFPSYTDPEVGDYHKYLTAGNYDITVTANGYEPQTQENIVVADEEITTVDFTLQPGGGHYAWRISTCVLPNNNYYDEGATPAALGKPDSIHYSLGKGGYVVLDMFINILDGPGPEIKVYENDDGAESYSCFAGPTIDGPWSFLGTGTGTASFDFFDASLLEARYIKILDDDVGQASGNDAGFDLDAVESPEQSPGVYLLAECKVIDTNGNNNERIDPGESFYLHITLRNHGNLTAENTFALLHCDSTLLSIDNPHLDFGTLSYGDIIEIDVPMTATSSAPMESILMIILNASANEGGYVESFLFNFTIGAIMEDWESNGFEQYPWATYGNQPWTITSSGPYEGIYSATSGNIGNNQNSVLEVQMDVIGYEDISFYRKVSSEANYDFLRFYIDGNMMGEWSGSTIWERESYEVVPGLHAFRWEYVKDGGVSHFMDCGWVDNISFPSCNLDGSLHALANAFPQEYCYPGETTLGAHVIGGTPPYSFEWSPADSLSDPNVQFPAANPAESTIYSVTVADDASATAVSGIQVAVHPVPDTPEIVQQGDSLISSSEHGNQWYDSQGMIEGATHQVYYPETEDDYYVVVSSEFGCVSEPSNVVHFLFTDIPEIQEATIKIYPVPAKNAIHVETSGLLKGKYLVEVMNLTGKILLYYNVDLKGTSKLQIDISDLPGGMYLLSFTNSETRKTSIRKIIK
jgi:hypothetical protein